jgi:hypothetical protein
MFPLELEASRIILWVGDVCKTFGQAHHEEDRSVEAHRNARVALFNLDERRSANRGALGHDRGRNSAPSSGVSDVPAQLAQTTFDGDR